MLIRCCVKALDFAVPRGEELWRGEVKETQKLVAPGGRYQCRFCSLKGADPRSVPGNPTAAHFNSDDRRFSPCSDLVLFAASDTTRHSDILVVATATRLVAVSQASINSPRLTTTLGLFQFSPSTGAQGDFSTKSAPALLRRAEDYLTGSRMGGQVLARLTP